MSRSPEAPAATVLLVWEDGDRAERVMRALLRAVVFHLEPGADPDKLNIEPTEKDLRRSAKYSEWRHPESTKFYQRIATTLKMSSGFVVFHADGDARWSDHQKAPSHNYCEFRDVVLVRLRQLLTGETLSTQKAREKKAWANRNRQAQGPTTPAPSQPERPIEEMLGNLFLWMPFYSIEAWLYQNTARAIEFCRARHKALHPEVDQNNPEDSGFTRWLQEKPLLDDVEQIKNGAQTGCCLKDAFNLELAEQGFPVRKVLEQRASMSAAVEPMAANQHWMAALSRTRRW